MFHQRPKENNTNFFHFGWLACNWKQPEFLSLARHRSSHKLSDNFQNCVVEGNKNSEIKCLLISLHIAKAPWRSGPLVYLRFGRPVAKHGKSRSMNISTAPPLWVYSNATIQLKPRQVNPHAWSTYQDTAYQDYQSHVVCQKNKFSHRLLQEENGGDCS